MNQGNLLLEMFKPFQRVEVAPHTNAWISGDRFGDVVKIGRFYVHVKMDRSGKVRKFVPENIGRIL